MNAQIADDGPPSLFRSRVDTIQSASPDVALPGALLATATTGIPAAASHSSP